MKTQITEIKKLIKKYRKSLQDFHNAFNKEHNTKTCINFNDWDNEMLIIDSLETSIKKANEMTKRIKLRIKENGK